MNQYTSRLWVSLPVLFLLLPLAACGGDDAEPTATNPESTEEAAPASGVDGEDVPGIPDLDLGDGSYELSPDVPEPDPAEDAPEQYRAIVSQADTYEYGESIDGANISYQYALVQMKQGGHCARTTG